MYLPLSTCRTQSIRRRTGNSPKDIVGDFDDADGNSHGFILSRGRFHTIDIDGAVFTSLNGVNAPGAFTGTYPVMRPEHRTPLSGADAPLPCFTRLDRSAHKPGPSMRRVRLRGPTGTPIRPVMASSGERESSVASMCPAITPSSEQVSPWHQRRRADCWQLRGCQWQPSRFCAEQQRSLHDLRCSRRGWVNRGRGYQQRGRDCWRLF